MRTFLMQHAFASSVVLALAMTSTPAFAQWSWRDAGGAIQYSDSPPPASVPQDRILKQPSVSANSTPPSSSASPSPSATRSNSEGATPSWADQNAEFVKRRQQRLDQEQKDKEMKQAAADKKRQCVHARDNLAIYEGATPVLFRAADGERRYMNSGERAAEAAKLRQFLKECR